jgi:hypothetical protein
MTCPTEQPEQILGGSEQTSEAGQSAEPPLPLPLPLPFPAPIRLQAVDGCRCLEVALRNHPHHQVCSQSYARRCP